MTTRPKINVVATLCRRCDQFQSFRAILMNASAPAQSVPNGVAGGVANAARPARFRRGRLLRTDGAARTAPSAGGKSCGLPGFAAAGFARRQRGISNRAAFRFRACGHIHRHSGPPAVIPASPTVIPDPPVAIPTPPAVIPAQAGIYACRLHYRSRGCTTPDSGASRNDGCRGIAMMKTYAGL